MMCECRGTRITLKDNAQVTLAFRQVLRDDLDNCKAAKRLEQETTRVMDTFGNCQRPVFSLGVSQQIFVKMFTQLVI